MGKIKKYTTEFLKLRAHMRRERLGFLLWTAAALFLICSIYAGRSIEEQQGQTGVRFAQEKISGERLKRIYEEEDTGEDLPWVTLWRVREGAVISREEAGTGIAVKSVELWGDVEQVYPECLMDGAPLSKADEAGCMLSGEAAFEVFGSTDVLGKKVLFDGGEYCIRGLLDVDDKLFVRETIEGDFSYMEAKDSSKGGTSAVKGVLMQTGALAEEGAVLEWDVIRGLLHLLRAFATGLLEIAAMRWITRACRGRKLFVWCVRIAAILLFVLVLVKSWCFSQEFIPGSWSDFEFFGELFQTQRENYIRYLDMPDILKDHHLFVELRAALGCIVLSALCSLICLLCRKWFRNAAVK